MVCSGVYCGPLRLLAWEVSNTLRGCPDTPIACDMITGQEKDLQEGARHMACTVEMTPLDRVFECAVLDEAQLLGDPRRGWAWTQVITTFRHDDCSDEWLYDRHFWDYKRRKYTYVVGVINGLYTTYYHGVTLAYQGVPPSCLWCANCVVRQRMNCLCGSTLVYLPSLLVAAV